MPRRITSSVPSNLPAAVDGSHALPQTAETHSAPAARSAGGLLSGLRQRVMGHKRPTVTAATSHPDVAPDAKLAAVHGPGLATLQQSLPQDASVELHFRRGCGAQASAEVLHLPLREVGFGAG